MDVAEQPGPPFVFTTLRWDSSLLDGCTNEQQLEVNARGAFYLVAHHFRRLHEAYRALFLSAGDGSSGSFPFSSSGELAHALTTSVDEVLHREAYQGVSTLRMKLMVFSDGRYLITNHAAVPQVPLIVLFPVSFDSIFAEGDSSPWNLYLHLPTIESDTSTRYKTHDRRIYETARAQGSRHSPNANFDVLLSSSAGIIDGCITTPYFYRQQRWVTPPASRGGLQGVTRRWALEVGLCVEQNVERHSLRDGERIWLSNGVRGFFIAMVVLP